MSCKSVQKQLSAYLDEQLSQAEAEAALKHAQSCEKCAHMLAGFRRVQDVFIEGIPEKQPSPEIWQELQLRISADKIVLSEKQGLITWFRQIVERLFVRQPAWARLTAFATVTLIAIVIGTNFWHSGTVSKRMQISNSSETQLAPLASMALMNKKSLDEAFLRQKLRDYLQKSDLVLTEIENYEQPEDVQLFDFTPEKTISKDLVNETLFIKKSLTGTQYEYLGRLIEDLEMVFLDIANLDESKAREEIEILSGAITEKDLLMKINVVKF